MRNVIIMFLMGYVVSDILMHLGAPYLIRATVASIFGSLAAYYFVRRHEVKTK